MFSEVVVGLNSLSHVSPPVLGPQMKRNFSTVDSVHEVLVKTSLMDLLPSLPADHRIFGSVCQEGMLRLPRLSDPSDGRKASWPKLFDRLSRDLVNYPVSVNDCWFVPATKEDGYHEIKLSADGSKGKFRTARALRVLIEPDKYDLVNGRDETQVAIHRCGHGKARSGKGGSACVNPYHVYFGSQQTNIDTAGCRYGAGWLCPHNPKCVFTWADTGISKPCLNQPSEGCGCPRLCSHQQ